MKDIILAIHPKWAEKIYSGEKIYEVRKTEPSGCTNKPLIYLYETNPIKKITGFVFLDWMYPINKEDIAHPSADLVNDSCLSQEELIKYSSGKNLYFWRLKAPRKFDIPIDLKGSIPQSWRYFKKGDINHFI